MIGLIIITLLTCIVSPIAADVDINCMLTKCGLTLLKCELNNSCRKASNCMQKCADSKDPNCQSLCFFAYATTEFSDLSDCCISNKCIPPQTWSSSVCPSSVPNRVKEFSLDVFARNQVMYVALGAHPIHDGLPCQKLEFHGLSNGSVATTWSTQVEGNVRSASYILNQNSPNTFHTEYKIFGMPVSEDYYIIDSTEEFVLYFYCGFGFSGQYQGTVIYKKSLYDYVPLQVLKRFDKSLKKMGLKEGLIPSIYKMQPISYDGCKNIDYN